MSHKIYIFLVFISAIAFICTPKKDFKFQYAEIEDVDSLLYKECTVKYKNSLYDNKYLLLFNVNIFYFSENILDNVVNTKNQFDSIIINNLNKSFEKQGIQFVLNSSKSSYAKYSINNFDTHYQSFENLEGLTILVYPDKKDNYWNGIAAGIPHTVMGIIESKIHTSTLPHELGHLLGLHHIFEPDYTDGKNAHTGDQVCDTPSYNIMNHTTVNCGYKGRALYTEEDLKIIIPNYLNYVSQYEKNRDCRNTFTPIQNLRMRWHIENFPQLRYALH